MLNHQSQMYTLKNVTIKNAQIPVKIHEHDQVLLENVMISGKNYSNLITMMNLKKYIYSGLGLAIAIVFASLVFLQKKSVNGEQPNIIFFIADDMIPEIFNCLPEGRG